MVSQDAPCREQRVITVQHVVDLSRRRLQEKLGSSFDAFCRVHGQNVGSGWGMEATGARTEALVMYTAISRSN